MRDQRFTFLCTEEERQGLSDLADRLQRSQSDTVRFLIRLFVDDLLHGNLDDLAHPKNNWRNNEPEQP